MTSSKTYLSVPYSEKDTAKSLGARWDASKKKWYIPQDVDISVFKKWTSAPTVGAKTKPLSASKSLSPKNMTYAKDKNFVAYKGEKAPWD